MYSRSERKFLATPKDPHLGPGSYDPDIPAAPVGKSRGNEGYAPFTSLTPRTSYFDEITRLTEAPARPAPGEYRTELLKLALDKPWKAPQWGKSTVKRFDNYDRKKCEVPGPGWYDVNEGMKPKQGHDEGGDVTNALKLIVRESKVHPLMNRPVPVDEEGYQYDLEERENKLLARQDAVEMAPRPKIVWKRKFGAPSIPGRDAGGFEEGEDGQLHPRPRILPPRPKSVSTPSSVSIKSGPTFARAHKSLSLTLPSASTPAPNSYNPLQVSSPLEKEKTRRVGLMGLSPCMRLTDEILKTEKRNGIPGPGSYEVKDLKGSGKAKGGQRWDLGGTGHELPSHMYGEQMYTPGPGAYDVDRTRRFEDRDQRERDRTAPFATTTPRFPQQYDSRPGPNAYNVVESEEKLLNQSKSLKGRVVGGFGSVSERFQTARSEKAPAPTTYQQEIQMPRPTRPQTRMSALQTHGPLPITLGNIIVNPANARIPVFGSQTDRFPGHAGDIPSVGAYEVERAFKKLVGEKGVWKKPGAALSLAKEGGRREIFSVKDRLPAPNQYTPMVLTRRDVHRGEGFLSVPRFEDLPKDKVLVPGPGSYETPADLIRKTYNVTLAV
ncbi:Sperm-tail PG-rich repeat-containing protein 2 [Gaertneriomyces sp. JEL0708]|nr:Sperm-tail PG-rich repeat-containing protein 2 [Gaertneriomyces sp. JEL0708]